MLDSQRDVIAASIPKTFQLLCGGGLSMAAAPDLKVVGQPVPRVEGPEKVSGEAEYTADVELAGTLCGKNVRSPHAHARIISIDTSRAKAMPGVHAVLTAADLPRKRIGRALKD